MKTGATYTRDSVSEMPVSIYVLLLNKIFMAFEKKKKMKRLKKSTKINLNKIEMGFLVRSRCSTLIHSEHFCSSLTIMIVFSKEQSAMSTMERQIRRVAFLNLESI